MSLNTLVNCIMQSLFFIDTIFKMSKSFCFLILSERFLLLSKTPVCMRDLIISTLKTMQVKSYGQGILKFTTFCLTWKFIQNLAKKISVTHVYSDVWEMKECLIQKYFLLIKILINKSDFWKVFLKEAHLARNTLLICFWVNLCNVFA